MNRPRRETICAVIVTRDPDDGFTDRLTGISRQVGGMVVVDNGSRETALGQILALSSTRTDIHLIRNRENEGIARALNQGSDRAGELGFEWILLFDQDSEPEASMVTVLAAIWDDHPDRERLAIIGSNYWNRDPGQPEFTFPPAGERLWIKRRSVITSGSLIPFRGYIAAGPFREDFFIDHVDDEYAFRARRRGCRVVMSRAPLMKHAIGVRQKHRVLFHTVETSNHSPERRYYMSRNVMQMAREYLFFEPGWVLWKLFKLLKSVFLIMLFEENRRKKLQYLLKGVWHGLRGKLGRLEDLV
ncbi:glycosyltransferase family 2 protein [Gemmatimonadota bacterium]